jgi:hypothetical protein
MMNKRMFLPVLGVFLIGSMACSGLSFLAPTATPTITLTPTLTSTPTSSPTATASPTSTRTLTPTKILGIETPVTVGEAQLQFQKALRRATYQCGDSNRPADNPDTEEYLLITTKVLNGPDAATSQKFNDWLVHNDIDQIQLTDDQNKFYDSTSYCYSLDSTGILTRLTFAFLVQKDAASFTLILPDNTEIPLNPIM